eukprot:2170429-Amphidinium_carterae.1
MSSFNRQDRDVHIRGSEALLLKYCYGPIATGKLSWTNAMRFMYSWPSVRPDGLTSLDNMPFRLHYAPRTLLGRWATNSAKIFTCFGLDVLNCSCGYVAGILLMD